MHAVLTAAAKHKVAMELNSYPDRLDLNDVHLRQAKQQGVKIVINTDSHHTSHMEKIRYGILQARRAWLTKDDVLNTLPAAEIRQSHEARLVTHAVVSMWDSRPRLSAERSSACGNVPCTELWKSGASAPRPKRKRLRALAPAGTSNPPTPRCRRNPPHSSRVAAPWERPARKCRVTVTNPTESPRDDTLWHRSPRHAG